MIERNLGNVERVLRVLMSLALCIWLSWQAAFGAVELFTAVVALFLFLNGVFSRCYLWFVLDVNTSNRPADRCSRV